MNPRANEREPRTNLSCCRLKPNNISVIPSNAQGNNLPDSGLILEKVIMIHTKVWHKDAFNEAPDI